MVDSMARAVVGVVGSAISVHHARNTDREARS